jgi:hypothetical protein
LSIPRFSSQDISGPSFNIESRKNKEFGSIRIYGTNIVVAITGETMSRGKEEGAAWGKAISGATG